MDAAKTAIQSAVNSIDGWKSTITLTDLDFGTRWDNIGAGDTVEDTYPLTFTVTYTGGETVTVTETVELTMTGTAAGGR